ncbi:hypothetical protein Psal006b_01134 [Piscirickettsia salmonis]|uniref:Uncharacterized protein n=1 Tax=Piscirickettsia salmonis TaxID=1238 RepID=A0A1L6TCY8_PISSA|nr:DUF4381 domain-containing protein [Piscirickettsia salmonis]AKP74314.1 hypothetical protein PSLF89_2719 [Piscirickettsia salmonis LF-89 = ATCC VR-1361]ALB23249.1 hypothetical protein KU39_2069 [Piscirickettsia salmonis]ALY03160.1 hypothetical protein AWE47_10170 [Piscirickettsia salmonis]AMA42722.1 hypothetical protein AWJ11_10385 [Piscirickettsia salmonis]AOS35194.1 hypothetical protein AVM72_07525 [Piscirickettsia salmonis]
MSNHSPLSLLKDIHAPEAVSGWPPAPGWLILISIVIILFIVLSYFLKKYRNRQKVKLYGLNSLYDIPQHSNSHYAKECNALLKRVAHYYFPEQNIKILSEKKWHDFLILKLPKKHHNIAITQVNYLITSLYQPEIISNIELKKFVQLWIKECR